MVIGSRLYTFLFGKFVGKDQYGNRYFESRKADSKGKRKRWVCYNGKDDASKIPANWHGWIHYTTDEIIPNQFDWQKDHTENLTGTKFAYFPSGHINHGGKRDDVASDYKAWNPNEN